MRFTFIALLATLNSLALAQSTDQLPKCGQQCVGNNFGGCKLLDVECICSNQNLISDLSCCVATNCSAADQNTIIQFAISLCKTKGINVPTVASCASTASATSAPSGNAAASGSSTASSAASAVSSGVSSVTSASSATAAAATTNAAIHNVDAGIGLGVAVAGLLAAL